MADWLRAGRFGDRIPVGGEIFRTCPDRPWGPPSLLYNGYRVFPGGKGRPGRDADPYPLSVPWSRKSRAIPLLPLWVVRPVQSLSKCTRVHLAFFKFHTHIKPKGKYIVMHILIFTLLGSNKQEDEIFWTEW